MKDLDNLKKIAVLIDAENAQYSKLGAILDELSKHGHVISKNAYGDWGDEKLKGWPTVLDRLAIKPHQQFARTAKRNAIDIAMVIDAMDMFHSEDFDAFALVSSDSDFASLASRLRRGGKYVFGFGEQKTPLSFRNACDDFVITEVLGSSPAGADPANPADKPPSVTETDLVALLRAAVVEYSESDGWTLASHAGAMIKRQRPDFQPRLFGCKTFLQVLSKLDRQFEVRRVQRGEGTTDQFRERQGT